MDTKPLRIPSFRRLWLSTVVTSIGSQLTAVAVPKQVFDITGSSAYVGLSAVFALVPLVVFALWGGAVADAMDRRKLLIYTNAGVAITSLLLWLQAATDQRSIWLIFVLLAFQQAFFGMNQPARGASVARLVPFAQLPAANALNSTVFSLGQVIGPLMAGVLIPVVGLPTLYLVDTIALCIAVLAVWRLPPLPRSVHAPATAGLVHVFDGLRYLTMHRILLVSFLADIIAMVFGMPRALFPEMAQRTFGDPPGGGLALGLLFAAIPIGAIVGGIFSGSFSRSNRHGAAVALAVAAWGVSIAGFGMANALWLAVLFLGLAGVADMVSVVFRSAILQTAVTDEMRGRTQGIFTVVVAGGPRVADVVHGFAGAAFGTATAVIGGGLLVVIATTLMIVSFPAFWTYEAVAKPE